ncbi:MAG: hypothetical protein V1926_01035 [Candidatus Peregrinibacteria bacterium]
MRRPVILSLTAIALSSAFLTVIQVSQGAGDPATPLPESGSGALQTGSGTGAEEQRQEALANERTERAKKFIIERSKTKNERDALENARALQWNKRVALNEECRTAIRKANKDSLAATIRRCFRSDITLRMNIWKKDMLRLEKMPGVAPEIRQSALEKTDALIQAGQAILDGIDTGVFAGSAEMEEAMQNLRKLFLEPKRLADARTETEFLRSWIAHLVTRASSLETETGALAGARQEAALCLAAADETLAFSSSLTDLSSLLSSLRLVRRALLGCTGNFLLEANPPEEVEDAEYTEGAAVPGRGEPENLNPLLLPRRILRRIGTPRS